MILISHIHLICLLPAGTIAVSDCDLVMFSESSSSSPSTGTLISSSSLFISVPLSGDIFFLLLNLMTSQIMRIVAATMTATSRAMATDTATATTGNCDGDGGAIDREGEGDCDINWLNHFGCSMLTYTAKGPVPVWQAGAHTSHMVTDLSTISETFTRLGAGWSILPVWASCVTDWTDVTILTVAHS